MWYVFFMALLMGLSKCSACWFIFVLVALVLAHKQRTRDLLFKLHFKLLHKLMVVFQQKKNNVNIIFNFMTCCEGYRIDI